ncbi:MAG: hypothetical protein DWI57_18025 [Chloroflexi bacterium]|nr:MAG: hypothetical protein DWI57_18025 [Chloroflexota bacterium]
MKSTGKSHWERFYAAVTAGNDEQAEKLVSLLGSTDEARLLEMAQGGADLRWWGLRGLAAVGDGTVIPVVAAALEEDDPALRAVAALALAALYQRHSETAPPFLPRLADLLADDDGLVRQTAADSLAQCGDAAVDVLAVALNSSHEGVRVRAATALHRIGTLATAPSLFHHLEDPNPLVRHYAYETLDQLGLLTNVLLKK